MAAIFFLMAGTFDLFCGNDDAYLLWAIQTCGILKYSLFCMADLCRIFKFYNLVVKLVGIFGKLTSLKVAFAMIK